MGLGLKDMSTMSMSCTWVEVVAWLKWGRKRWHRRRRNFWQGQRTDGNQRCSKRFSRTWKLEEGSEARCYKLCLYFLYKSFIITFNRSLCLTYVLPCNLYYSTIALNGTHLIPQNIPTATSTLHNPPSRVAESHARAQKGAFPCTNLFRY